MAGIFPAAGTSAEDAFNTILDLPLASGCIDLWYNTGSCKPVFDARAANAVMSELLNVMICANGEYNCNVNTNLLTANRFMLGGNAVFLGVTPNFVDAPPGSNHPIGEDSGITHTNVFQIVNEHECLNMVCALFADANLSASSAGTTPAPGIEAGQQDGAVTGHVSIDGGPDSASLLSSSQAFNYGAPSVQQPRALTRGILPFTIPPLGVARLSFEGHLFTTKDDFAQNSAYRTVLNATAWYHWHYQ